MPLPVIVEAFDLDDIFPFLLDDVGVSTYCKGVMATTFLALLALKISLAILIFLASLTLIGRNWCLSLDTLAERMSVDLILPKSFSSFFLGLFPWEYLESIFQVPQSSCNNAFTSASIVFLITSF